MRGKPGVDRASFHVMCPSGAGTLSAHVAGMDDMRDLTALRSRIPPWSSEPEWWMLKLADCSLSIQKQFGPKAMPPPILHMMYCSGPSPKHRFGLLGWAEPEGYAYDQKKSQVWAALGDATKTNDEFELHCCINKPDSFA